MQTTSGASSRFGVRFFQSAMSASAAHVFVLAYAAHVFVLACALLPSANALTTTPQHALDIPAPEPLSTSTEELNCTLVMYIADLDLGASNASGYRYYLCEDDVVTERTRHLEVSEATALALRYIKPSTRVTLVLQAQTRAEAEAAGPRQQAVHRIVGREKVFHKLLEAYSRDARAATTSLSAASSLAGNGHYLGDEASISIKLLSVVVSLNGEVATYAGGSAAAREAWAAEQRALMDLGFRWSTYGKIGFDPIGSMVRLNRTSKLD